MERSKDDENVVYSMMDGGTVHYVLYNFLNLTESPEFRWIVAIFVFVIGSVRVQKQFSQYFPYVYIIYFWLLNSP